MDAKRWIAIGALSAAALAAAAVFTGAVKAADLGGNAAADLEERVAELEATTARKGNRKVTLTISGQVSRSILRVDYAGSNDNGMVDNFNSPSRFRFAGEAKIDKDFSAGYFIEIGVGSPEDSLISGADQLSVRHNALWIGTPIGKVFLGHTSSATDGIVEINTAENVNLAALPFASHTGFDGARGQVLKWESPTMAGFMVSAAWTDSLLTTTNGWDAALRYAGEGGGFKFAAGAGYADNGASVTRVSGSASVMHIGTGAFLTANMGRIDGGARTIGGTAGVARNVFGIGETTVFGEYSRGDAVNLSITPLGIGFGPIPELEVIGFGVVQSVNSAALDVFATYRQIDVGAPDTIGVFMAGARVKF